MTQIELRGIEKFFGPVQVIKNLDLKIEDEIIRINTEARPIALQIALLVPLLAAAVGILLSFRMVRLPDIQPSADLEGLAFD